MQRQSLGSPAFKLNIHGPKSDTTTLVATDTKRKDLPSTSLTDTDDDDLNHRKPTKPRRFSSPSSSSSSSSSSPLSLSVSPSKPEKFIHFIPLLTFLCFLVLYLVSHNPSQSDLAHFNGFKRSSTHIDDSSEIGDVSRYTDAGRGGDVLVVRSFRNLQEITDKRKSRFHRKIAHI